MFQPQSSVVRPCSQGFVRSDSIRAIYIIRIWYSLLRFFVVKYKVLLLRTLSPYIYVPMLSQQRLRVWQKDDITQSMSIRERGFILCINFGVGLLFAISVFITLSCGSSNVSPYIKSI